MISCVERASLHFCSDAAAARVANARMQPSGALHRLCEAYCQRLAGRSFPDAHAAFHDVFSHGEPSATGVGAQSSCRREPARRAKLGRPAQVVVPGGGLFALASTGLNGPFGCCVPELCATARGGRVLGGHGRQVLGRKKVH